MEHLEVASVVAWLRRRTLPSSPRHGFAGRNGGKRRRAGKRTRPARVHRRHVGHAFV